MKRRADLVGTLAFTLVCLAVLALQPVSPDVGVSREADAASVVLLLLATLPLALRRRFPLTVAAIVVPVSIFGTLRGYALNTTSLGALFAIASAAYCTDRPRSIAIGAFSVTALLIGLLVSGGSLLSIQSLVGNLVTPVLAVAIGDAMRGRREYAMRWRMRAREVEELRVADQQRAVAQERVRVAREVHDVVGHRLAAITIQARAGCRVAGTDPALAAEALAQIDSLATAALAETRGAVGQIADEHAAAPVQPLAAT